MDSFDLRLWEGFKEAGGDLSSPAIIDQITIDSRRIDSKNTLFIALEGKFKDGHHFIGDAVKASAKYVITKKNGSLQNFIEGTLLLKVDNPLKSLQQIAATYRKQLTCSIIAIAGSYGKTMVKDLLQDMLGDKYIVAASPESFNSQIGVALSLLTLRKEHTLALIEMGFSLKNEMDTLNEMVQADYGIITHIGKKHISTLGSLDTVANELIKIFISSSKKKWAIVPKDDYALKNNELIHSLSDAVYFWSDKRTDLPHAFFTSKEKKNKMTYQIDFPDGEKYEGSISSGFYYFLDLINITTKAAWLLKISSKTLSDVLRQYTPEPMRTEIWKLPLGSTVINDTYCSDPQSVEKTFKTFCPSTNSQNKTFIFGGMRGKQQHSDNDYKRMGNAIAEAHINRVVLYGPHNFKPLIDELSKTNKSPIPHYKTYKEALLSVKIETRSNDLIIIKGDSKHSINEITEIFNDSICNNQYTINLAAVAENIERIKTKTNNTRMMVIVKALAYGTDEVQMAKFLETCGIEILGVSYADEGISLKRAGVSQAIFVINAAVYEAAKVVKWDLEIGVSDEALIKACALEAKIQNKKVKMHLHIDTGMSRFGCRAEEALSLAKLIQSNPLLELEGVMTHFACADDPSQDLFTRRQIDCFDTIIKELHHSGIDPKWVHASNSAGAIRFNLPQYNMVRIGLAIYGLQTSEATKEALELRFALSLISHIVGINTCKKGETISYGRSFTVTRDKQLIAVLPIGYFDGLHRKYSDKGFVMIQGKKAPMVGKICMDYMMVDITDIPNVSCGDSVLIFGEDEYGHYLSPEDLTSHSDFIVHELITCLGPRIQRFFVVEEALRTH